MEDVEDQRLLESINSIKIDSAKWIAVWMASRRRAAPPSAGPAPLPQDQPRPMPPIAPASGQATHQTHCAGTRNAAAMRAIPVVWTICPRSIFEMSGCFMPEAMASSP